MRYHYKKPERYFSNYGEIYECDHPVYNKCTLYLINNKEYFDSKAKKCKNGLYPTVSIRQIMWALRMKPLKKERWETYFDRKEI